MRLITQSFFAIALVALSAFGQTTTPVGTVPSQSVAVPETNVTVVPGAPLTISTNQIVTQTNVAVLPSTQLNPTNAPTRILTLQESIRLALQHNLDIQIQRYNPEIDQYILNSAWGVFEPVASFEATKNYNDSPGGFNPQTGLQFAGNVRESDTYTPDVKGILPTGGTYDFTGSLSRNSIQNTNPAFYLSPTWATSNPGPGVALAQPLLKNFWIDSYRLAIQLDKVTLRISEQALRFQIMATVTAVKSNYYNLLYARGNVDANALAYKLAEQLVAENVKRVEVGALAPLDEKQSESQAATSLAAYQQALLQLNGAQNSFKNLLTDKFSEWAGVVPLPADQLVAVPQNLNLQESWRLALTQRPDLQEAKLRVESQNVTLKYQLNQIFPELDLVGSYGRNANENTFGDALDTLRQGNHSYYSYGASVTFPLGGNYSGRNNYKSAKATLKQLLLSLKQSEQNIMIQVDNDVATVRSTLQQVYATRDARIYADDALSAERQKLENGKSTSFVVLQLISNLTVAKVAEIQALATYNIALAQLEYDEGNTLSANRIDMKVR